MFRVYEILVFPVKLVFLVRWVDNTEGPVGLQIDPDAVELNDLCQGVKGRTSRSTVGTRKFGIATCAADVVGVFEVKVAVWHEAAGFDCDHWFWSIWLNVGNTTNGGTQVETLVALH